jgi:hypothetical protein
MTNQLGTVVMTNQFPVPKFEDYEPYCSETKAHFLTDLSKWLEVTEDASIASFIKPQKTFVRGEILMLLERARESEVGRKESKLEHLPDVLETIFQTRICSSQISYLDKFESYAKYAHESHSAATVRILGVAKAAGIYDVRTERYDTNDSDAAKQERKFIVHLSKKVSMPKELLTSTTNVDDILRWSKKADEAEISDSIANFYED